MGQKGNVMAKVKVESNNPWVTKDVVFTSLPGVPLIMHNPQTVDPENEWAQRMRPILDKKAKYRSVDELKELAMYEFYSGLYMDGDEYIIPGENVESMFNAASHGVTTISKAKAAGSFFCPVDFRLTEFDGPKDPDKRYKDKMCQDRRCVKIGTSRIMRVRPLFRNWKLRGKVCYLAETFTMDKVFRVLKEAGIKAALGDYRPKFGRFSVEVL